MRILSISFVLLVLPCVLNALNPQAEKAYNIAILSTMSSLERMLPKEAAITKPMEVKPEERKEVLTLSRQASCERFTMRRAIGCICEITREQLEKRNIPREASRRVMTTCASLLGVGKMRFERICDRMGFDISGNPRSSIAGIQSALVRCGPRVGIGSLGTLAM